ncbi:hypothetical protein B0H67DRAFT_322718 [Lasiosphaeris hirsuta]|uniref:C2H2-type domain-containing protein n=1 Tax=Lasiosphaeris hirsuta TaxID=260670 RepID=A0AA40A258_9PEZI|nr:hypothetical protein B0H67DRAFT_322718 [Lasiosphaeris hirsuta]
MSPISYPTHDCSHCFSAEEQGEWVWVPMKVPVTSTYQPSTNTTANVHSAQHTYISANFLDTAAKPISFPPTAAFNYSHEMMAADAYSYSYPPTTAPFPDSQRGDATPEWLAGGSNEQVIDFDIHLALTLQTCLGDQCASTEAEQPMPEVLDTSPLSLTPISPEPTQELSSPYDISPPSGAFVGDAAQLFSWPTPNSTSPLTTMATPQTTASATPCSIPTMPELLFCPDPSCFETFTKTGELKKHERKHKQPFRCALCGKGHLDKRALDRHLWSRHKEYAKKTGAKSERIRCRKCDYESRADNVRRHERSQHGLGAVGMGRG